MSQTCVYIEWVDSASSYGWRGKDEWEGHSPITIRTIGYLLNRTKSHLTVTTSVSDNDNVDSPLSIPRKAITKYKSFELPE